MPSRVRAVVLLVAGLLLLLSACAHAFLGWPHLRGDLAEIGAGPGLAGAIGTGWLFGSVAMLAFGLIVLPAGIAAWRGGAVAAAPLWVIAAAYVIFGTAALALRGHSLHFWAFILIGILVAAGAVKPSR